MFILAYSVWKKNCSDPECGPICDGAGCMNFQLIKEYFMEFAMMHMVPQTSRI